MKPLTKTIALDKSLDGARILVRHFLSRDAGERWVREFSPDGEHVRMSRTQAAIDAGTWFRVFDMRVEAVLEPAKAAALAMSTSGKSSGEPPNVEDYV
jgi:hypothetical protein